MTTPYHIPTFLYDERRAPPVAPLIDQPHSEYVSRQEVPLRLCDVSSSSESSWSSRLPSSPSAQNQEDRPKFLEYRDRRTVSVTPSSSRLREPSFIQIEDTAWLEDDEVASTCRGSQSSDDFASSVPSTSLMDSENVPCFPKRRPSRSLNVGAETLLGSLHKSSAGATAASAASQAPLNW